MAADFVFKLYMVLCVFHLIASWMFGLIMLVSPSSKYFDWELEAQRKSIHSRIWDPVYRWQKLRTMDAEMSIYTHGFYGYALVNMEVSRPPDRARRTVVLSELERLISVLESEESKPPFDGCLSLNPKGGIIATGYVNLLRAGYVLLGGANPRIVSDFHSHSRQLYDDFQAAPIPVLESYPRMIWPNDNCAALESLRLHDVLYASSYRSVCVRFEQWMKEHLDPQNGMMFCQVDQAGHMVDVPRGCALSWSLSFMPGFAPALDRQQYELYRQFWFVPVSGMFGIREWWPGQQNVSVIPSGPVVADIGAAASGLGIAATHANCDLEAWVGLLRGLELISFPSINLYGEKSYCGGIFMLGDVMALWAKSTCIWDKPYLEERLWQSRNLGPEPGSFKWVIAGAFLVGLFLLILLVREAVASWKVLAKTPISRWPTATKVIFAVQCMLVLAVFLVPLVLWPYAVLCLLAIKLYEKANAIAASRRQREISA